VTDQNNVVLDSGAFTNTQYVNVSVEDFLSGPGRIEVSQGGNFLGGNSGLTTGVYFDGTLRPFSATDNGQAGLGILPALGTTAAPLGPGTYSIRALDQAGNEISTTFTVGNPIVVGLLQDDVTSVPNGGVATSSNTLAEPLLIERQDRAVILGEAHV
jgi:hypothetical protein